MGTWRVVSVLLVVVFIVYIFGTALGQVYGVFL